MRARVRTRVVAGVSARAGTEANARVGAGIEARAGAEASTRAGAEASAGARTGALAGARAGAEASAGAKAGFRARARTRARINLATIIVLVFLTIVALAVLYPVVYIVSAAFTPGSSIALDLVPFGSGFTLEHFRFLFKNTNYPIWFANTLIIAISTSTCTVALASLSAYVFSRFRFTLKRTMMMALLILQIFPSFIGMVAIYVILLRIGGLNTLWGLVLVYVAGNIPYNTWLVKSYLDTIPRSLDEAAIIDGASHFRVYWQIVMPVARPILTFLAIASFTGPWMDFIFPKLVLRSADKQTLALGLFSFVTDKKNQFTTFAAGALLVAVPFIIFFVISQKLLIESLGASAVKE